MSLKLPQPRCKPEGGGAHFFPSSSTHAPTHPSECPSEPSRSVYSMLEAETKDQEMWPLPFRQSRSRGSSTDFGGQEAHVQILYVCVALGHATSIRPHVLVCRLGTIIPPRRGSGEEEAGCAQSPQPASGAREAGSPPGPEKAGRGQERRGPCGARGSHGSTETAPTWVCFRFT